MIAGTICLYKHTGELLSNRQYHSLSGRVEILKSWRHTYGMMGKYYEISPRVDCARINLADGTNSKKVTRKNIFISKEERERLEKRYAREEIIRNIQRPPAEYNNIPVYKY